MACRQTLLVARRRGRLLRIPTYDRRRCGKAAWLLDNLARRGTTEAATTLRSKDHWASAHQR